MQCKSSKDCRRRIKMAGWCVCGGTCSKLEKKTKKVERKNVKEAVEKTFAYALIKGNDVRECGSFLKTQPGCWRERKRGLSVGPGGRGWWVRMGRDARVEEDFLQKRNCWQNHAGRSFSARIANGHLWLSVRKTSAGARVKWKRAQRALTLHLSEATSSSAALSAAYTPHWVVVVLSGLLLTFCLPCAPL